MEIVLLVVVVIAIGAFVYYNRNAKGLDINNDGKIDAADVKAAVQNVVEGAKTDVKENLPVMPTLTAVLDVNKDGKVDSTDVVAVKEKAKSGAKKAASKAKETVKKATSKGRKPKADKV